MFLHLLDEVSCSSKDGDFRRTLILLQIWNLATQNLEAILQIVLRFLSRTLCDARLCSSSDSVPSVVLDPTELSLCNRLVW